MLVCTEPFAPLARHAATAEQLPGARIVVIPHPLGGIAPDAVESLAAGALDDVLGFLSHGR